MADQWQPIETAPKSIDTDVVVYTPGMVVPVRVLSYYDDAWRNGDGTAFKPTHWRPLPNPPLAPPPHL